MSPIEQTVATTIARRELLSPGFPLLLMVSGGGDSVAAAHLLARGAFGDGPARILHVNHGLRANAQADEEFVRALGVRLGVATRVVRFDVAGYAQIEGLNLEDAGRRVRYRFAEEELDLLCDESGIRRDRGRIVVAHTADDRVETFFMRALFGAGARGLASIANRRGRVVRPLLDCDRDGVRAWLGRIGETWREDESNEDASRLRARVRSRLVPVLADINPDYQAALLRSMDLLADDDALLSAMADGFARDFAATDSRERVELDCALMATLDRTMARRTVRAALARVFPEASRLESEHIEAVVDGLAAEQFARDLAFGLRAQREYGTMVILRSTDEMPAVAPTLLSVPGTVDLGRSGTITARLTGPDDASGSADSVVVDLGEADAELIVDSAAPGDRIRPLGMQGSRKVSDLLIDSKVPRRLRGAVPVVRSEGRIVWDFRLSDSSRHAVRLTWERTDEW